MGDVPTRYHVSLDVEDRPGVLAQVAHVFAEHGVSIETVRQAVRRGEGRRAALVVVTHQAPDAALAATVDALADLDIVASVDSVMRVEGTSGDELERGA
jgi:homoserine dehydrogenase